MCTDRQAQLGREAQLREEDVSLAVAGRMVVVIVEPAFADRNGAIGREGANGGQVARRVEARGIVRVHAGGKVKKARRRASELARPRRGGGRFPDADDGDGAGGAGARDHRLVLAVEGRIGEVGVTIDERRHADDSPAPAARRPLGGASESRPALPASGGPPSPGPSVAPCP